MTTVVLVHGLWMPGAETLLLRRRLVRAGFHTRLFTYASVARDVTENARRLAAALEQMPRDTVHLLGHSLGGVVAVRMLQSHPVERLGRVVCLGSPLAGSSAARALARLPGGRHLMGASLPALVRAPVAPWTGPAELGVIAGSLPVGFGRLLGGLPSPNDGTVAVEETRLSGMSGHIVLPVSHFSMLWSAEVARQVVSFLRSGGFAVC